MPSRYQPSGRTSPLLLVLGPLALVGAAAGASLYGWVTLFLPFVWLTALLTVCLGAVGGALVASVLRRSKTRSRFLAFVASTVLGLVTTWAMWLTWVGAALVQTDWVSLLWPPTLWSVIRLLNTQGVWSFNGTTPTGVVLWCLWALEAAVLVAVPVVMGLRVARQPFCEHCDAWCQHTRGLLLTPPVEREALVLHLEVRDFSWVRSLGVVPRPPPPLFARWDLAECRCRATNTLSVVGITVVVDGQGRQTVKEAPLIEGLLLAPDVVPSLRELAV